MLFEARSWVDTSEAIACASQRARIPLDFASMLHLDHGVRHFAACAVFELPAVEDHALTAAVLAVVSADGEMRQAGHRRWRRERQGRRLQARSRISLSV
eukprot:4251762-Pleurochrysis_carterae.AAC.1